MLPAFISKPGGMGGGAPEESEHSRQDGVGSGSQEGLAGHTFGFVGHGRAVGGVVAGPLNHSFLDAPDHSPDVQEHDPADAAADADRKQAVALPAVAVEAQEEPSRDRHY